MRFDLGVLHYASDTPYSRRQSLLSKSLSFFGVESTYACAIAIVRRIFEQEVALPSASPNHVVGEREQVDPLGASTTPARRPSRS